ncbi:hypothetical protein EGX52_21085 [Yersinia pseudotuberculosis]|nr:hypothetical protein EGX52_21085 [Yersinia pseudotuberculosis]
MQNASSENGARLILMVAVITTAAHHDAAHKEQLMNNIEELREHCKEMMAVSRMPYAYIPASSIITLIDRIEKAEAALSAANERLSKPVVLPRMHVGFDGVSTNAGDSVRNKAINDCAESIRTAGFTVEGE